MANGKTSRVTLTLINTKIDALFKIVEAGLVGDTERDERADVNHVSLAVISSKLDALTILVGQELGDHEDRLRTLEQNSPRGDIVATVTALGAGVAAALFGRQS